MNGRLLASSAVLMGALVIKYASGATLPRLEAPALDGGSVVLPQAARGSIALLIFGFTRASQENTSAWGRRAVGDCTASNHCQSYAIAVLEDVPRLLRSIVVSSIRKGVPSERQRYFLTLFHDASIWKTFLNYREPDDAYLVLLDRDGNVRWRFHGPFSDANYGRLRQELRDVAVREQSKLLQCCTGNWRFGRRRSELIARPALDRRF